MDLVLNPDLVPLNISTVLSSWTNQRGHPILLVERDYPSGSITISQKRFLTSRTMENDTSLWYIPLNYATKNTPNFNDTSATFWLDEKSKTISLSHNLSADEWIIFNKQQTGYYRVLYDDKNWELISKELNSGELSSIHPQSRSQLIFDLYEFSTAGLVDFGKFFDLTLYLKDETEYAPWAIAAESFSILNPKLADIKNYKIFQNHVSNLVDKLHEELGQDDNPNEEYLRKELRVIAIDLACRFKNEKCLEGTYKKLQSYLNDGVELNNNYKSLIYQYGIRSASEEELENVWSLLNSLHDKDERSMIVKSFASIDRKDAVEKYLEKSLSDSISNNTLTPLEMWTYMTTLLRDGGQYGLSVAIRRFYEHSENAYITISLADSIFSNQLKNEVRTL